MWVSFDCKIWNFEFAENVIGKKCYYDRGLKHLGIETSQNYSLIDIDNDNSLKEYTYDYKGAVFCIEVSSGVFMVRSNGKSCWTGNSRSRGPNTILTRQACEGRSKDGGLKCGEFHFATKSTDFNFVLVH
jgi:hypothetical protein